MSGLTGLSRNLSLIRVRRFAAVGAVAAFVQTVLLWVFVERVGFWYLIAAPIVIEITIVLQYFINNAWTFHLSRHTSLWSHGAALLRTNIVRGTAIPIQTALLYILANWLGLMYLVANLGGIFITGFYRYYLDSRWTWRI